MLKVITANLNGIRSAVRKGFFTWLHNQNADVVCVQELKAQEADIADEQFQLEGYHGHFHYAQKKGYSGVAVYSRIKPQNVVTGLGWEVADNEGRYVAVDLGKVWVASLYLPSGTSGEGRQEVKYDFLDRYALYLDDLKKKGQELILCGDWNIAHREIDLKNWKTNQKNSGFLPAERAWLDKLFNEMGFVDTFRVINQEAEQYTWWSHRGQAWAKNVGWRIDYQIVTPNLKSAVKSVAIYKEERFSDHAPLIVEYDMSI